ncbi:MAG: hypothetical protein OM95_16825 [Bdellovibrio sp. ArHS]|uniref:hypothetical protein n=1 Tax=Bdellovibrio sp. ArHS TaxID=1569284 RepID=UPI00058357B5|nr:hypothetical protein [Bdellovibrio sp. ArHS]KHD87012.1 MAG: hypothetical protein OM95_16825 [Bdellovibrio sp. ArHS]
MNLFKTSLFTILTATHICQAEPLDLRKVTTMTSPNKVKEQTLLNYFDREARDTNLADIAGKDYTGYCFDGRNSRPVNAALRVLNLQRQDGPLGIRDITKVVLVDESSNRGLLDLDKDIKTAYLEASLPGETEGTVSFTMAHFAKTSRYKIKRVAGTSDELIISRTEAEGFLKRRSVCYMKGTEKATVTSGTPLPNPKWVGHEYFQRLENNYYTNSVAIEDISELKSLPKYGLCVSRQFNSITTQLGRRAEDITVAEKLAWTAQNKNNPNWLWATEVEPFRFDVVKLDINYGSLLSDSGEKILSGRCGRACSQGQEMARLSLADGFESTSSTFLIQDNSQISGSPVTIASLEDQGSLGLMLTSYRKTVFNGKPLLSSRSLRINDGTIEEKFCYSYSDTNIFDRTWYMAGMLSLKQKDAR